MEKEKIKARAFVSMGYCYSAKLFSDIKLLKEELDLEDLTDIFTSAVEHLRYAYATGGSLNSWESKAAGSGYDFFMRGFCELIKTINKKNIPVLEKWLNNSEVYYKQLYAFKTLFERLKNRGGADGLEEYYKRVCKAIDELFENLGLQ